MSTRLLLPLAIGLWGMLALSPAATLYSAINNGQGGTFELDPGTVYTGDTIVAANTTINGNGATLQLAPGEYLRVGPHATLTVRHMTITGGNGIAISADSTAAGRLVGELLTITNPVESGVVAGFGGRVNLQGCLIIGGVYGVYCYSGAVLENLTGCTLSGQSDSAIFLNNSPGLNIRNTNVNSAKVNGILALGASSLTIANSVFENIKSGNGAHALSIQHSQNVLISENTIVRHNDKGIFLNNCPGAVIRDTTVLDCFYLDGISLQGGSTATIENCEVSLCQAGVAIINGSSATILNSYLHNNKKKQTSPVLGQGIFVLSNSSAVVKGCVITNNDNEGIYIQNSQFLIVEDCLIAENGWVALDGNGVFCDNTPGFIRNNKIIHNYLKGVQSRTKGIVAEGNEIRRNGRGGITILTAPGQAFEINENLIHGNGSLGGSDEELNVSGSNTIVNAANNLLSNSGREGVLVQSGGYLNLRGSIVRNNQIFGVNMFNGNARLEDNVIYGSQRNVYHNGANASEGRFNAIFAASVSGVEAINCSNCPLPYQNNWWGHPTGPAPAGQGVSAINVAASPWLTAPSSASAVFENISAPANTWSSWQNASLPWARLWVRPSQTLDGQFLAAQASLRDLFIRIPKSFNVPPDTIYLYILGSYDIRRTSFETILELTNADGSLPNLAVTSIHKFNKDDQQWQRLNAVFNPNTQSLQAIVDDLQGLYLISPSGSLVTGTEQYMNRLFIY